MRQMYQIKKATIKTLARINATMDHESALTRVRGSLPGIIGGSTAGSRIWIKNE